MGLRTRHGNAARSRQLGSLVEVQPLDEQGDGMQARPLAEAEGERKPNGQLAPGSQTVQSKGGRAKKNRIALSADPAIKEALAAPEFRPMLRRGSEFRKGIMRHLAQTCGGGECDPMTAAVVAIAADQLAASRFFMARAAKTLDPADFTTASRLGDASRQNLIASRELATKHGEARRRADPAAALRGGRFAALLDPKPAPATPKTESAPTRQPEASTHAPPKGPTP
jgi:hypothetical protein